MELIQLIESKYEVEKIRAHGHQVWPLIRFSLGAYFQTKVEPYNKRALGIKKVFQLAAQFFYGFHFYFRKYEYLSISDSSERRLIDGQWVDKSLDNLIENLPPTLLIELPLPQHYHKSVIPTKFIASKLPLYVVEKIYGVIFLRNITIENEDIVKQILVELNIQFDYLSVLRKNMCQYKVGRMLCRIYKPKGLILQPSYTNMGFVKAFKDSGAKVIEVQHGLISSSHEAYNVFKKFDSSYYPDYFLSYGTREKKIFEKSFYFSSMANVVPVGHYYLDVINNSTKTRSQILPELKENALAISITGQNLPVAEVTFIRFMVAVAHRMPHVIFVYIPRNLQSAVFAEKDIPGNWLIAKDRDTYELIRLTACHTTMFSTCAVEALALGTPNILVNIDNLARTHLKELLGQSNYTAIVDTVDDYVTAFDNLLGTNRHEVMDLHSDLIVPGYRKNVQNFVNDRILKKMAGAPAK